MFGQVGSETTETSFLPRTYQFASNLFS